MLFLNPDESVPRNLFKDITPEWAWEGSTGKGVRVAIVDSGIDYTHPELAGSVKEGIEVIEEGGQMEFKKGLHQDAYGHGTACAGIIRSIAPEVEFYSVKVLGSSLSGTGNVMMAGIKWAVDNGMDVANLSLGTTKDLYYANLHKISDSAYFNKCHLVAALSNTSPVSFPAVFSSLIGVKAVDEANYFNFYINPEPPVEIYARGIMIKTLWLDHDYIITGGNSFAAPVITGIVSLIRAKHPYLTSFELKCVLYNLAHKWEDYGKIESPLYKLQDLSAVTKIPQESLEKYLEKGLISPLRNDKEGIPLFEQNTMVRAKRLHILSDQNFTPDEILKKLS